METLQFICLKWGAKYSANYVNRIYNMIQRFTKRRSKLYCITDNSEGLYPEITPLPLTNMTLTGWWHKLSVFQADLYGLKGSVLFLDLDVVITRDLTPLFDFEAGSFVISREFGTDGYNSSVFRLEAGSMPYVWETFLASSDDITSRLHGDQDWINLQVSDAKTWPENWVVSYKKQCNSRIQPSYGIVGKLLRDNGLFLPKDYAVFPDDTKVVQFHGKPDPEDVMSKPYGVYKAAPWITEFWR